MKNVILFPAFVNCQPKTSTLTGWHNIAKAPTPWLGSDDNKGWSQCCFNIGQLATAVNKALFASAGMVQPVTVQGI